MDKSTNKSKVLIIMTLVVIVIISSMLLLHLGKLVGRGLYYILN